jgi:hypothetical protein
MPRLMRRLALLLVLAGTLLLVAGASAAAAATIDAKVAHSRINLGQSDVVSGQLKDAVPIPAGASVSLEVLPYPFKKAGTTQTTTTDSSGRFSFKIKPDRWTHYRVKSSAPNTASTGPLAVQVRAPIRTHVRPLSLGRVAISATIAHPHDLRWSGRRVFWSLAGPGGRRLHLVAHSTTHDVHAGLTRLTVTVTVPAGRQAFLGCFRAPLDHALLTGGGRCGGVSVAGRFTAPEGFPNHARVSHAARYLAARRGRTAFAVYDSQGRMSGMNVHRRFVSASVVKAMLLVSYLRKLDAEHRGLDGGSRSILYPMIHVSDNNAATAVWRRVGDSALRRLAHRVGMTDFSIVGIWARAQISAADQARFFFYMDDVVPRQFRGYARYLLSHISGAQSWGIPSVGRPHGYAVFFKGGWRGTAIGQLVHQVARVERRSLRFSLAVMTDGNPSMGYGIATIRGVAQRLF